MMPYASAAQDTPLDPSENPDVPIGDPDAPVDGGIGLLVAAGVAYGVKKYRDNKKAAKF